jgi:hypothetical protein
MFICQRCDQMRDSDDGCTEGSNFGLICEQCMNEAEDDEETYHTYSTPAEAGAAVRRKKTYSYDEIYNTLVKGGCPEDIAAELAKEKSR